MATFTANPWVTGEIITADGLNGDKGYKITLSYTDMAEGWEITNIGANFTPIDFLLKFKIIQQDGFGLPIQYSPKYISKENEIYRIDTSNETYFYYNPLNGGTLYLGGDN